MLSIHVCGLRKLRSVTPLNFNTRPLFSNAYASENRPGRYPVANFFLELPAVRPSQRDGITQPRVARNELPWVRRARSINPERVASIALHVPKCANWTPETHGLQPLQGCSLRMSDPG